MSIGKDLVSFLQTFDPSSQTFAVLVVGTICWAVGKFLPRKPKA